MYKLNTGTWKVSAGTLNVPSALISLPFSSFLGGLCFIVMSVDKPTTAISNCLVVLIPPDTQVALMAL